MNEDARWQAAWQAAGLGRARREPGRPKFFEVVAYPGPSGFLHVGHLRGLVYADTLARFHRMNGRAVFFPTGLHASGLPAVTFAQKVRERRPATVRELEAAGVPEPQWRELEDPERAARFLGSRYLEDYRSMGLLVDESAYLTTLDDDYRAFIRWQFHRFHRAGVLRQGAYYSSVCPVCGPVAVDPSETDLSTGGDAEVIEYVGVPFRLDDGRYLLASTLRPETIYGVTNLWVSPREPLVEWVHRGTVYLVSRAGARRLALQYGEEPTRSTAPHRVLGHWATVPETDERVPILESALVDPTIGTGVVMSVPSHAPADALALLDLAPAERARIPTPRVLIEIPDTDGLPEADRALVEGAGTPAERALRAVGAYRLDQVDRREEATHRLYRLEYARGRVVYGPWAGRSVAEARRLVAERLAAGGRSFVVRQFSKPVRCRNDHEVEIRRVPDQWFLAYGRDDWKERVRSILPSVRIVPDDYAREFPAVVDWLADRPCTRQGRWLGTRFPLDPEWVIEPIADSTLYPAYYIVRRLVREHEIPAERLTDAFFDFVFLGEGPGEPAIDPAIQRAAREEFLYWYPLDWNIGGKEHKRVHFPVFLFAHALLFPPALAPRGIFVHGWVTGSTGAKLSKRDVSAKGGSVPPLRDGLREWGADALRLYYALSASAGPDVEWDSDGVTAARDRLADVRRLIANAARGDGSGPPELEAWLESTVGQRVEEARSAIERLDVKGWAEAVYVGLPAAFRRYALRGGSPSATTRRLAHAWIRLLSPLTPHLAESLGATERLDGLVAALSIPSASDFARSPEAEAAEAYLDQVEEDLRAVVRSAPDASSAAGADLVFFVAAPWKAEAEAWMRDDLASHGAVAVGRIVERARTAPHVAAPPAELVRYVQRVAPLLRAEERPSEVPLASEERLLRDAAGYFARRFGFGQVTVVAEDNGAAHDPLRRRDRARPGRPAFYVIRPLSAREAGASGVPGPDRRLPDPTGGGRSGERDGS